MMRERKEAFALAAAITLLSLTTPKPMVQAEETHLRSHEVAVTDLAPGSFPLSAKLRSAQSANSTLCLGDGASGPRFEVIYAHLANKSADLESLKQQFSSVINGADALFDQSAKRFGANRHLRLATENCQIKVDEAIIPAGSEQGFYPTIQALNDQGFKSSDRKYIVFLDASPSYCGTATVLDDDRPSQDNINNLGPSYAVVSRSCWSDDRVAHEAEHTLGAVQLSAPHSTGDYHCTDAYDLMCQMSVTSAPKFTYPCPYSMYHLLDCDGDDYFNPQPQTGSYLATHWNTANSQFLTSEKNTTNDLIIPRVILPHIVGKSG